VRLDNDETKESNGGFIRFPNVQPGAHYLEFSASGYQTVRIKPIIVKGGEDNFIDFPALAPLPAGVTVSSIVKEEKPPDGPSLFVRQNIPEGSTLELSLSPIGSVVGATLKLSSQENRIFTDSELRQGVKIRLPGGLTSGTINVVGGEADVQARITSPTGDKLHYYKARIVSGQGQMRRVFIFLRVQEAKNF